MFRLTENMTSGVDFEMEEPDVTVSVYLRLSKLVASVMRARILDLSSNDSQFIFD